MIPSQSMTLDGDFPVAISPRSLNPNSVVGVYTGMCDSSPFPEADYNVVDLNDTRHCIKTGKGIGTKTLFGKAAVNERFIRSETLRQCSMATYPWVRCNHV